MNMNQSNGHHLIISNHHHRHFHHGPQSMINNQYTSNSIPIPIPSNIAANNINMNVTNTPSSVVIMIPQHTIHGHERSYHNHTISNIHNNKYPNNTNISTSFSSSSAQSTRRENFNPHCKNPQMHRQIHPQIQMSMNKICNQTRFIHVSNLPSMVQSSSIHQTTLDHRNRLMSISVPIRTNTSISTTMTNPFQLNTSSNLLIPTGPKMTDNECVSVNIMPAPKCRSDINVNVNKCLNTDSVSLEQHQQKNDGCDGSLIYHAKKLKQENCIGPHSCHYCGKRFNRRWNLKQHLKTHTKEKPFACDYLGCSMTFSQKHSLKNHVRTHTGEKPFECTFCPKAFAVRHNLITHLRLHTGEKPYICNICKKKFVSKSGVNSHIKHKHNN